MIAPVAPVIEALFAANGSRPRAAKLLGVSSERVRQLIVAHDLGRLEAALRWAFRPTSWERAFRAASRESTRGARRRKKRRRQGQCATCSRRRDGAQARCSVCRAKRTRWQSEYLRKRRQQGLCGRCPSPAVSGKSQCQVCLNRCALALRLRKGAA